MRTLRLLIIALATICALALGVFALVSPVQVPGDDIIIKGGSLEIQCKSGTDCLGPSDGYGKYKHNKSDKHILQIVVKDSDKPNAKTLWTSPQFDAAHQPQIEVAYR